MVKFLHLAKKKAPNFKITAQALLFINATSGDLTKATNY